LNNKLQKYKQMKKFALGIDIGGTNTVFGLVNKKGDIFYSDSLRTKNFSKPTELVKKIYEKWLSIKILLKKNENIIGVGIGAPNGNYYTGCIEFAPNLNWKGEVYLSKMFKRYFSLPVYLNNDANVAALGEMIYGGARKMRDFIVVTIGTGLGSGFVANRHLIYGHDGLAGELGHTLYEKNGRLCGCGKKGCLEAYVSSAGLIKTVNEILLNSKQTSILRSFNNKTLTPLNIQKAAIKGDKLAIEVYWKTGTILGEKLADAVAITGPAAIFLAGGISFAGNLLIQPAKEAMEKNLLPAFRNKVNILQSELLSKNAAVLGAAAMVWHKIT